MAVRRFRDDPFSGNQEVVCAAGGCTTLPGGAWTIAALVYCRGGGSPVVSFRTGSSRLLLQLDATTFLLTGIGGFSQTLVIPDTIDQWVVVGASRPAGGSNTVRGHVYYYDTDTVVHDDLSGTGFDEGSTIDNIRLGRNPDASASFHGEMGLVGAWAAELADAQFEALVPGIGPWIDLAPVGLWPLNQDDVGDGVPDLTDNGADQTAVVGTTVVTDNDPPFNFSTTPPQGTIGPVVGVDLSVAGGRPSAGTVAPAVGLELAVAGGRPSAGTVAPAVGLELAVAGARGSAGTVAPAVGLQLAIQGWQTQVGRPVTPYPGPIGAVGSFFTGRPVTPFLDEGRPVRSFSEVPT